MLRILIYYVIYCAITGKRVNIHYVIMAFDTFPCYVTQENFSALHESPPCRISHIRKRTVSR